MIAYHDHRLPFSSWSSCPNSSPVPITWIDSGGERELKESILSKTMAKEPWSGLENGWLLTESKQCAKQDSVEMDALLRLPNANSHGNSPSLQSYLKILAALWPTDIVTQETSNTNFPHAHHLISSQNSQETVFYETGFFVRVTFIRFGEKKFSATLRN